MGWALFYSNSIFLPDSVQERSIDDGSRFYFLFSSDFSSPLLRFQDAHDAWRQTLVGGNDNDA